MSCVVQLDVALRATVTQGKLYATVEQGAFTATPSQSQLFATALQSALYSTAVQEFLCTIIGPMEPFGLIRAESVFHLQVVDDTALTISGNLLPDEVVHLQIVDETSLVPTTNIFPDEVRHLQFVDASGITFTPSLLPSDVEHLQVVDGSTLTISGNLLPEEIVHLQVVDSTSFVPTTFVNPVDVDHLQFIDDTTLTIGANLIADEVVHLQVIDDSALTIGGNLLPTDVIHEQFVDATTLLPGGTLAPQAVNHIQVVDDTALTVGGTLVTEDVVHLQVVDESSLSIGFDLTPEDVTHLQFVDETSLDVLYAIFPVDADHLQVVDDSVISVGYSITPADVDHLQIVDETSIDVVYSISPTDVDHIQVVDETSLDVLYVITPTDADHLQVVDETVIDVTYTISPTDVIHLHEIDATTLDFTPPLVTITPADVDHLQVVDETTITFSSAGTHAEAEILAPSENLDDFSLLVDLSRMPPEWWDTAEAIDPTLGQVTDGDDVPLPVDWFYYDKGTESGAIRVKLSLLANPGTPQKLKIYPPTSDGPPIPVLPDDPLGQYNAYDEWWYAYWPLVSDGQDRTSNAQHATPENGVTAGSGVTGPIGRSTTFNGTDHYFDLPPTTISNAITEGGIYANNVIASGWVNLTGVIVGGIIVQDDIGNMEVLRLRTYGADYQFAWWTTTGSSVNAQSSGIVINDGLDHQLAGELSSSFIFLYGDGQQRGSLFQSGSRNTGSGISSLGVRRYAGGAVEWMNGDLSDLFLHTRNRSAGWFAHEYAQGNDQAAFYSTWIWTGG